MFYSKNDRRGILCAVVFAWLGSQFVCGRGLSQDSPSAVSPHLSTASLATAQDAVDGHWKSEFSRRLMWWSLQPLASPQVPIPRSEDWAKTDVDRFILTKLESSGLQPVAPADPITLVRRLSFALTGLPPSHELVEKAISHPDSIDYASMVSCLLDSPHFGERWARHWMDVVHYADTHGYEWDVPAKEAWRYRDYLIRAFNDDIPFRQLILEQIAGDMLPPRINPSLGINESIIGPMMLRLGERRHGDNSAAEGVSQEAIANSIDTIGKAFLATTLACAQCHDHKLDAVEQKDYYSLSGMLMSTRFSTRSIDISDPNESIIQSLQTTKHSIRLDLSQIWLAATEVDHDSFSLRQLQKSAGNAASSSSFPSSLVEIFVRSQKQPLTIEEFANERSKRVEANRVNLTMMVDFSRPDLTTDWRWEGFGMKHGLVGDGAFVISDQPDAAILHLLPAGRYTHVWSSRLAGLLQSPQLPSPEPITFSIESVSGKFASQTFVVDRALNSERLQFPKRHYPQWQSLTAGKFDSLEGTLDTAPRRVYFELATKSFNNYFPPRVGYGGVSEDEVADDRSWFGVSRVYRHLPGKGPQDELERFLPLFDPGYQESDWAKRLIRLLHSAIQRWATEECTASDVELINDAIKSKWLPNQLTEIQSVETTFHPERLRETKERLLRNIAAYRTLEKSIRPDRTIGSAADWDEGCDERIGIRGSYTDLGDFVSRGHIRFLKSQQAAPYSPRSRLEFAQELTDVCSHIVARVYVNRIWHFLFGSGLVRTTDDFGNLGESPSHPELLDFLAQQFIKEGWSTKRMIRNLVSSAVWQQSNIPKPLAAEFDPENRLWHHRPIQRLEAEAIRDAILFVSGRLDNTLYGQPIEPHRTAIDTQKRLMQGPVDGLGRRSLYLEMTLMEPPRFLAIFNQPIPKLTVGRRDRTNVPDQALAMLNDPFVGAMSRHWSEQLLKDDANTTDERLQQMIHASMSREASVEEIAAWRDLAQNLAKFHGISGDLLRSPAVWQDLAHVILNMKEFIYVR